MGEIRTDEVVSDDYRGPDRRRPGLLGKIERATIHMVRSKWVASFIVAVAVSWCFHIVEDKNDRKLEHQQEVTLCVVQRVHSQPPLPKRSVERILQQCEKQEGK